MPTTAETIQIARRVMRMSVRELAEKTGVSTSTINRIERGHDPDMDTARRLSGWMGICVCCGKEIDMPVEPASEPEQIESDKDQEAKSPDLIDS